MLEVFGLRLVPLRLATSTVRLTGAGREGVGLFLGELLELTLGAGLLGAGLLVRTLGAGLLLGGLLG